MATPRSLISALLTKQAADPSIVTPGTVDTSNLTIEPNPVAPGPNALDRAKQYGTQALDSTVNFAKGFNDLDPRKWDSAHQTAGAGALGLGAGMLLSHLIRRKKQVKHAGNNWLTNALSAAGRGASAVGQGIAKHPRIAGTAATLAAAGAAAPAVKSLVSPEPSISDRIGGLVHKGTEAIQPAIDAVKPAINTALNAAKPAIDTAKNYFSGIGSHPIDWAKSNPVGAGAIGVGAAGLLAWLLSRKNDNDDEG